MNRAELVKAIAKDTHLRRKDVDMILKSFVDVIAKELRDGEKVQLVGFGTFETVDRPAGKGRNPRTGETVEYGPSRTLKFRAGKILKEAAKQE